MKEEEKTMRSARASWVAWAKRSSPGAQPRLKKRGALHAHLSHNSLHNCECLNAANPQYWDVTSSVTKYMEYR